MNRAPLFLAGAAVIGVGLAFLLFQAPDTGGDMPVASVKTTTAAPPPAVTPAPPPKVTVTPPPKKPERPVSPNRELEERRAQPDAVNAGTQAAAWTGIRREFLKNEGDKGLSDKMADLIRQLRDARRNPDAADFGAIGRLHEDVRRELDSSGKTNSMIQDLLDRLDAL